MFRLWSSHSLGSKIFNKYIFVGFFVLLFSLISVSGVAIGFEVKLGDALDKYYDNYKRNSELNELNGKAVVDDIYNKSLDLVKNDDMVPMFDAVDKTMYGMNDRYDCMLNKQDIINILYFSNNKFKRDLKNNLIGFQKPKKDDLGSSCNKLNVCIEKPVGGNFWNTVVSNNNCQNEVGKEFTQYYLKSYYIQTIQGGNKGSNFFWNLTLDDSSYDIMNDVYLLSKILFADVPKPEESRFYKMPKVDYQQIPVDDVLNGDIDWFSPYNTTGVVSGQILGDGLINSGLVNTGVIISGTTALDEVVDKDIVSFVEGVNFDVGGNADSVIGGNMCATGIDIIGLLGDSVQVTGTTFLTPGEYLSGVLGSLAKMSCNGDGVYQDWESSSCEDAKVLSSNGISDIEQIEALLNAAQQSGSNIDNNNPALGCFQKCDNVPCSATSCDKIICYAKCSCMLYESPTFDPSVYPGLTSVFKIKFCVVPVMDNNLSTHKTVYNISAIFSEIYKVLQNLRNSGEMSINVKTKEFLDNGKKSNKLGKQLSFNMNSTVKSSPSEVSEFTQIQEQIDLNTSWMEGILGFSKDNTLEYEKNKYVVMDDPCYYIVSQQNDKTVDQSDVLLSNCHKKQNEIVSVPDIQDIEVALKNQKTVLLDAEFESFLRQNRDFWFMLDDMFDAFVKSSKTLSEK